MQSSKAYTKTAIAMLLLGVAGPALFAQTETADPSWMPKVLGMQYNGIAQDLPPFSSPYQGQNSLRDSHNMTSVYGAYMGSQIAPGLQAYMDIEMIRGGGVGKGIGLGGYTNGDALHSGSSDLGQDPYVARLYLRYLYPLSGETSAALRAQDQLPGNEPASGVEFKAGRMSASDTFDQNRYANNTRTQFMNYDFINNVAWDYAADTRGYSYGVTAALYHPEWRLAFGAFAMPKYANGMTIDDAFLAANETDLELTLKPAGHDTVVRALAYLNQARMGNYDDAVALAQLANTTPDVVANDSPGRTKYGFGLNVEQPLADNGETGLFGRIGWNDGHNESFVYAEADRHASVGMQLCGARWHRDADRVGIAYAVDGLSSEHKAYLAAGGSGFMLGDGQLNYAVEQVAEVYYRVQLGSYIQITPDFQFIINPGYNSDRGPAQAYALRARVSF